MFRDVFAGDGRVLLAFLAVGFVVAFGVLDEGQAREVLHTIDRALYRIF